MKKLLVSAAVGTALVVSGAALAGKPANPGCFGQDRAAILHSMFIGNKDGTLANGRVIIATDDGEAGASRWGKIAGERASTNGQMNRAYKEGCGGGQPD